MVFDFENLIDSNDYLKSMLSIYKFIIDKIWSFHKSYGLKNNSILLIDFPNCREKKILRSFIDKLHTYLIRNNMDLDVYFNLNDKEIDLFSYKKQQKIYEFVFVDKYQIKQKNICTRYHVDKAKLIAPTGVTQDQMFEMYDLLLNMNNETFIDYIYHKANTLKYSTVELCKRSNISSEQMSKLTGKYKGTPRNKHCALALCLAVKLSLEETQVLLSKAGFGLSDNSEFDKMIEYFITARIYDVNAINACLVELGFEDEFLCFSNRIKK